MTTKFSLLIILMFSLCLIFPSSIFAIKEECDPGFIPFPGSCGGGEQNANGSYKNAPACPLGNHDYTICSDYSKVSHSCCYYSYDASDCHVGNTIDPNYTGVCKPFKPAPIPAGSTLQPGETCDPSQYPKSCGDNGQDGLNAYQSCDVALGGYFTFGTGKVSICHCKPNDSKNQTIEASHYCGPNYTETYQNKSYDETTGCKWIVDPHVTTIVDSQRCKDEANLPGFTGTNKPADINPSTDNQGSTTTQLVSSACQQCVQDAARAGLDPITECHQQNQPCYTAPGAPPPAGPVAAPKPAISAKSQGGVPAQTAPSSNSCDGQIVLEDNASNSCSNGQETVQVKWNVSPGSDPSSCNTYLTDASGNVAWKSNKCGNNQADTTQLDPTAVGGNVSLFVSNGNPSCLNKVVDFKALSCSAPAGTTTASSGGNSCQGKFVSFDCSAGYPNNKIKLAWDVTSQNPSGACNIFVRGGLGDTGISTSCKDSVEVTKFDSSGGSITNDGHYQLLVSDNAEGTDCYNKTVDDLTLTCNGGAKTGGHGDLTASSGGSSGSGGANSSNPDCNNSAVNMEANYNSSTGNLILGLNSVSGEGSAYVQDSLPAELGCGLFPIKWPTSLNCKPTKVGDFKWTHKWQNGPSGGIYCSKDTNITVGALPASTTNSTNSNPGSNTSTTVTPTVCVQKQNPTGIGFGYFDPTGKTCDPTTSK